jgi:ethanolamine phosphate transferase 2 subunit G
LLRVARRWNQTGQKFAGEPDIARTFLPSHSDLLWTLVCAAYLPLDQLPLPSIRRGKSMLFTAILLVTGVSFKLAFTKEDDPEQIGPLATALINLTGSITAGWSLVALARLVFFTLSMALIYSGVESLTSTKHDHGYNTRRTLFSSRIIHSNIFQIQ